MAEKAKVWFDPEGYYQNKLRIANAASVLAIC
jgi:hypothetical protein